MSASKIASRYAKSLLDLSLEQGSLEKVMGDISILHEALTVRELVLMLKSPIIHGAKKNQILDSIFSESFEKMTSSFIQIIVKKGREQYLPEIVKSFIDQYRSIKEISGVKLITAVKLSDSIIKSIKEKCLSSTITAKSVEISTEVKPDIIGGFILEIGDKKYDASVANKLNALRKTLTSN